MSLRYIVLDLDAQIILLEFCVGDYTSTRKCLIKNWMYLVPTKLGSVWCFNCGTSKT